MVTSRRRHVLNDPLVKQCRGPLAISLALVFPVAVILALVPHAPGAFFQAQAASGSATPDVAQPETAIAPVSPRKDRLDTPTAQPVVSAAPTAPAAPAPAAERILMDRSFSSASGPAPTAEGWPDNPHGTSWMEPDGYALFQAQPARFVAIRAPVEAIPANVRVTAEFRKTDGPSGGGYGVIVRDQSPRTLDGTEQSGNYLVFEAGDRGEFGVWRRSVDHWDDLITWTPTTAIRRGTAINTLMVEAIGSQLTFVINDQTVARLQDAAPAAGGVGVFLGGDFNRALLEHIRIQALS